MSSFFPEVPRSAWSKPHGPVREAIWREGTSAADPGGWTSVSAGKPTPALQAWMNTPDINWVSKFGSAAQKAAAAATPTTPGGPGPGGPGGGGSGGRGGRGGGGRAGPSAAQVRAAADQTFGFNRAPWLQMYDLNNQQVNAVNKYNPDFAAMDRDFAKQNAAIGAQETNDVHARMAELSGLGRQISGDQASALQGALRDLGAQGANAQGYVQQALAQNAAPLQGLGNQGTYLAQQAANQQASSADYARGNALLTTGAKANLANNRNTQLAQLATSRAATQQQQAQAEQANDQAKREFLLKYGVF